MDCLVCGLPLQESPSVEVTRGLQTLIAASLAREDGLHEQFKNKTAIQLHINCRKSYTRRPAPNKDILEPYKKVVCLRSELNEFDIKLHCLFCGESADKCAELKQPRKYRRSIHEVSTLTIQETIRNRAKERNDELGNLVLSRIDSVIDLVAAEAKYHRKCYNDFRKINSDSGAACSQKAVGRPCQAGALEAFNKLCDMIDDSNECQYSLQELHRIMMESAETTETVYTIKTLKQKLLDRYKDNIIVSKCEGKDIVSLTEAVNRSLADSWYMNRETNIQDERHRIILTAASIIREDIRTCVYNNAVYPLCEDITTSSIKQVPDTLRVFVDEVTKSKSKNEQKDNEKKSLTIQHAIISTVRPRSFLSSLQISLAVFLHRRFASRQLIDILAKLGVAASYKETLRYVNSVVRTASVDIQDDGFLQYIFDNADFNVRTLDGLGTFHSMGGVQCVSPSSAVSTNTTVPRIMDACSSNNTGGTIPIKTYRKSTNISGLQTITAKASISCDTCQPVSAAHAQQLDTLWVCGSYLSTSKSPGWSGYMQAAMKGGDFETAHILALPFINLDPGNLSTIYTALMYAVEGTKSQKQTHCVVTFDQPLYMKAVEIVAACDKESPLSKVIVRLGGFHLLMSFMGATGTIMRGSGLEELWATIYAATSVRHMISGHAYYRALRAHFLTQAALTRIMLDDLFMNDEERSAIQENFHSFMAQEIDVENVLNNKTLKHIHEKLTNIINQKKGLSRTAELWLRYHEQVSLMKMFVRAERTGQWDLHLYCVREMLPYFHAAGHLHYAKSAQIYLQQMTELSSVMPEKEYEQLTTDGFFTVRRSNRYWSGTWTDMIIEQYLMKGFKSSGGLTHGRGITESTLAQWIKAMPASTQVCEAMENFTGVSSATTEQHVELRDSRQSHDKKHLHIIQNWLKSHSPFQETFNGLVSLATGIIADDLVNCDVAKEVGLKELNDIDGKNFSTIRLKRKNIVRSISVMTNGIKVRNDLVAVNSQQLFSRIICVLKDDAQLANYMTYELAPKPPSLFDDISMRKGQKAALSTKLESYGPWQGFVSEEYQYVVDGGHLLYKVVWPRPAVYRDIFQAYTAYVLNHYGKNSTVVFDGYPDVPTTKFQEQDRRASKHCSIQVAVEEECYTTIPQADFLCNKQNKTQLINKLQEHLQSAGITVIIATEDADTLIVQTAWSLEDTGHSVAVVGDDTDLLVLLVSLSKPSTCILFIKPGKAHNPNKTYDIRKLQVNLGHLQQHLLFLHAVTGCDTTSAIYGKGKKKSFDILKNNKEMCNAVAVFNDPIASKDKVAKAGEDFLLSVYGVDKPQTLDKHRFYAYKRTVAKMSLKSEFQLSTLPPTSDAARLHSFRVFLQVQKWHGNNLSPLEWGWERCGTGLKPIPSLKPPAPDDLLHLVSCNCRKGCLHQCECRRAGLMCSSMCGQCRGTGCENSLPLEEDAEENDENIDI